MGDHAAGRPPLVVGLTGGIASGKSAVAAMFVAHGAGLVDTDAVAREVVAPGEPGLEAVRAAFGFKVLSPSGELNRAALRALVFEDDAKRRQLEALLHPLIRARTLAKLAEISAPYAVVAVPLLVETDFGKLVDRVLVVDCPEHTQLERLMKRDAIPRPEALAMLRARRCARRSTCCIDAISNSQRSRLDIEFAPAHFARAE
jgi:dephospho-CoA kinase